MTTSAFAFEPFLPLWAIVAFGLCLLALSFWIARRDSRFADRPKLTFFLFVLRATAVVILLWILLGPTLVTTIRKFKTKSIAILVDASASMGLVDAPDGSGNVTRWTSKAARPLDESIGALRGAQLQLEQFSKMQAKDLARTLKGITEAVDQLKRDQRRPVLDAARLIENKVLPILRQKSAE